MGHDWYHGGDEPGDVFKIEAVTVCIGYEDFLEEAAKYNRGHFSRWIIITSRHDTATREICRRYNLETLLTEDHKRGGKFNKGRLIEKALKMLSADGWRLHIDGDIILPTNFINILRGAHLRGDNLYGCDRLMIRSREQWNKLLASGWLANDFHCRVNFPYGHTVGSRWAHKDEGYVPIGFFQLWHASEDTWKGARVKTYPVEHNDACRTDVQFGLQWDRRHRHLIPELIVVHLESEAGPLGVNWEGRKTKRF